MRVRILNKRAQIFVRCAQIIISSIISVMVNLSAMSVGMSVMELMEVVAIVHTICVNLA